MTGVVTVATGTGAGTTGADLVGDGTLTKDDCLFATAGTPRIVAAAAAAALRRGAGTSGSDMVGSGAVTNVVRLLTIVGAPRAGAVA